jgi:protoporphyrinogen/coproporphyrinogen III oxidase
MKRVVIVGSGLAGLSAGYRLHEQGCHVTVFETLGRVGGRVLSELEDGFLFDVGPTIVTDNYTEYMKLVRDVGLSDKLIDCAPEMAVVKGSDLHILNTRKPLRSFLTTKLLPSAAKLRLMARGVRLIKPLYGMNPYDLSNRVQYDTESIEAYIDRVFGRELNNLILDGMTRSMVTSSPDEASVVGFLAGAVTASGKMQTLEGGLQLLPSTLAEKLDVRLSSPVTEVRSTDRAVEVDYQSNSGIAGCEHADACVIATPFQAAVDIYEPLKAVGAELLSRSKDAGCCSLQLRYSRRTEKEPFLVMVPKAASVEIRTLFLEHVKAHDRAPASMSRSAWIFGDDPR